MQYLYKKYHCQMDPPAWKETNWIFHNLGNLSRPLEFVPASRERVIPTEWQVRAVPVQAPHRQYLNSRVPVVYLGFEYRSVHEGERRGFTVKPAAKYVDVVQLQNAKAVMTPLTEQKSLNLHDETTVCDQVQHSLFRAVIGKLPE